MKLGKLIKLPLQQYPGPQLKLSRLDYWTIMLSGVVIGMALGFAVAYLIGGDS